jgi:phosphoribosylanthranilate isomerase
LVKVKICGITNLEDALASALFGADAIGFVFYQGSCRYINPLKAAKIARILPAKVKKIGVFFNPTAAYLKKVSSICKLDFLQLHGDETIEFCRAFKRKKLIKSFRVNKTLDYGEINKYPVKALLFDSFNENLPGGTGKKFDWKILLSAGRKNKPIFLSGGLTPKNVAKAIKIVKPDWVDASSCLESGPGKKNHRKIKEFIKAAKTAG